MTPSIKNECKNIQEDCLPDENFLYPNKNI